MRVVRGVRGVRERRGRGGGGGRGGTGTGAGMGARAKASHVLGVPLGIVPLVICRLRSRGWATSTSSSFYTLEVCGNAAAARKEKGIFKKIPFTTFENAKVFFMDWFCTCGL